MIHDYLKRPEVERMEDWSKWQAQIPWLQFPADWKIQITPPFAGAMVRFRVTKEGLDDDVSIYLDCHEKLGMYGGPYWEVYKVSGDTARCSIEDTESLLGYIAVALEQIESV